MNSSRPKVYIHLESNQLGDCIAWLPYIDIAREKYNWDVYTNFHYFYLFKDVYPSINFEIPSEYDRKIVIDITNREKPLQWSAANALGVTYTEQRPRFNFSKLKKTSGKTITFSEYGSNYCKSWNNPFGWIKVIQHIKTNGYQPIAISKEPTLLSNVTDCTGLDLLSVCNLIYSSSVYIGVSSGLAWLAWCLGVPVIMVSGHTKRYFEFNSNIVRLGPSEPICFGCYNDNDLKIEWEDLWCPHYKGTARQHECTYSVSHTDVINAVNYVLNYSLKI